MKNFLWLAIATLTLFFKPLTPLHSQTVEEQIDFALQNLDLSQISSGLLIDRTIPIVHMDLHESSTASDSIYCSVDPFCGLHMTMVASQLEGSDVLDNPSDAYMDHFSNYTSGDAVSIFLSAYEYQRLDPDAVSNGDLTISNGQLHHATATANAFMTKRAYASAFISYIWDMDTEISLDPDMLLGNVDIDLTSVYIDLYDGLGYQHLTVGNNIETNFDTSGLKVVKLKFQDIDGNSVVNYTIVEVKDDDSSSAKKEKNVTRGPTLPNYENFSTDRGEGFHKLISVGGDTVHINVSLSCGTGDSTSLRRPLIILDGIELIWTDNLIDARSIMLDNERGMRYTDPDIDGGTSTLGDLLSTEDYDIIFVDYRDHHARIQDNAAVVEEVIRQINGWKAINGSTYPNTVLGISMGGVVGKYALRNMELNGEDHDVDKYFTFDSPMQGANVPLALQETLKSSLDFKIPFQGSLRHIAEDGIPDIVFPILDIDFNGSLTNPDLDVGFDLITLVNFDNVNDAIRQVRDFENVLLSDAAQQLTVYSAYTDDPAKLSAEYVSFYSELENMGDLENCETISIANGSVNGTSGGGGMRVGAGGLALSIEGDSWDDLTGVNTDPLSWNWHNELGVFGFIGGMAQGILAVAHWALMPDPNVDIKLYFLSGASDQEYYKFRIQLGMIFNLVKIGPKHSKKTETTMLPLDSAPGGMLGTEVFNAFDTSLLPDFVNLAAEEVCFIPTASALDLQPSILGQINPDLLEAPIPSDASTSYNSWYAQNMAEKMRFTAPIDLENSWHVEFTFNNISKLLHEATGDNSISTSFNPLVNATYNFGDSKEPQNTDGSAFQFKSTSHNLPVNFSAQPNGLLWINRAARIADIIEPNNPINANSSYFDVYLRSDICNDQDGIVEFEMDSELHIGDNSVNNTGDLFITTNTQLHLYKGSKLTIEDGSRLIVEDGGELHLYSDADINLFDDGLIFVKDGGILYHYEGVDIFLEDSSSDPSKIDGSKIQIEGTLVTRGGGLIEASGDGYFHFSGGEGNSHIYGEHGGGITFVGHGKDSPKFIHNSDALVIHKETIFRDCNVMNPNAQIRFEEEAFVEFHDSRSYGGDYIYEYVSRVYGSGSDFELTMHNVKDDVVFEADNCTFYGNEGAGKRCIESTEGIFIILRDCHFYKNDVSIKALNTYAISLRGTEFTEHNTANVLWDQVIGNNYNLINDHDAAIVTLNTPNVYLNNVIIDDARVGISAITPTNVVMRAGSTISNCKAGVFMQGDADYGVVDMDCSRLIDNVKGIYGQDILLNIDAEEHAASTDCKLRPNSFINTQNTLWKMFDIKYVEREVMQVAAKGNYWRTNSPTGANDGLVDYVFLPLSGPDMLDYSNYAMSMPTDCDGIGEGCYPCPNLPCSLPPGEPTLSCNSSTNFTYNMAYATYNNFVVNDAYDAQALADYQRQLDWIQSNFDNWNSDHLSMSLNNADLAGAFMGLGMISEMTCEDCYRNNPSLMRRNIDISRSIMGKRCCPFSDLEIDTDVLAASCGLDNGQITVTTVGGVYPFTISWDTGRVTYAKEDIYTALAPGDYDVTVSDASGCEKTAEFTIDSLTGLNLENTTVIGIGCNGSSGSIQLKPYGGSGVYQYSWNDGSQANPRSGLVAGIYRVTVVDANGCQGTDEYEIKALDIDDSYTVNNLICGISDNGSIVGPASGGTAPYTYQWSTGATTADLYNLTTGQYSLTVTDATGCSRSQSFTISTLNSFSFGSGGGDEGLSEGRFIPGGSTIYWSFNPATVADQLIIESDADGILLNTGAVTIRSSCACTTNSCNCADLYMGDHGGQTVSLIVGTGNVSNPQWKCSSDQSIPMRASTLSGESYIAEDSYISFTVNGSVCGGSGTAWSVSFACDQVSQMQSIAENQHAILAEEGENISSNTDLNETSDIMEIFPNPTSSTVIARVKSEVSTLELQTIDGKLIQRIEIGINKEVDISLMNLASGVYLMKALNESNSLLFVDRVIKI